MRTRPLALLLLALAAGAAAAQPARPYWNNLEVYRLNKLQPHACVVPDDARYRLSLNGTWQFAFFDRPDLATLSPARWDSIRVPGNIELQGFGVPVYVNMRNEFPSRPPYAPADYNPTGVYARTFTLPEGWRGRRTIAKFGAAAGGLYLYVNGREVGYSQDSKTPAEWDITRYLHDGTNTLAAKLVRWTDGSYLECQDMWRLSGLTRDVELYSLPPTYVSDFKVIADLDTATFSTGRLDIMVDLNREVSEGSVEVEVCGRTLTHAFARGDWFATFQAEVEGVSPWTDSTPALYPLVITLRDAAGRPTHRLTRRIGFRHLDIRDGQLRLNGRPLVVRGVNRHEHSPAGGHYVSPAEMRRDIGLMKQLGINAVRTCHYPDDELWYDLCDSAGILLWDEANVESHAQGYGDASLAKKREWLNPILDRVFNMYRRDRNHPSVIVWSLGNECGNGYCFEEAYRFLKGKDNTRPVAYERALTDWNTDIVSVMYSSAAELGAYARDPRNRRPFIVAEYCHAMGNSMGGLQDYWDTIARYPLLQGGFVWDWMDQAFRLDSAGRLDTSATPFAPLRACWAVGGDLGALPGIADDDNFCANGLLAADGTLHPHAYEVQAVYGAAGRQTAAAPAAQAAALPLPARRPEVRRSRREAVLQTDACRVAVSAADGSITSYRYRGRELLATPLRPNFWRPPTDNDLADPLGARAWQGLDRLEAQVLSLQPTATGLLLQLRLATPDGAALRLTEAIDLDADGRLLLSCTLVPAGQFLTLPKVGFQFGLDTAFSACLFEGNLYETYPDRRTARREGTWYKPMDTLAAPQYVVPQEQGNREARWVRFLGPEGRCLAVGGTPMSFSVRRHNDTLLTAARRWCALSPDGHYTVSIDYRNAPLGTAACGPGVSPRHVISGDSVHRYAFTFDPTAAGVPVVYAARHPDVPAAAAAARPVAVARLEASAQPAAQYGGGFPATLTDGRRAVAGDYRHGWAGFQGLDTLTLDLTLQRHATLAEVGVGAAHCPSDWVMAPLDVQLQWSIDGRTWSPWRSLEAVDDGAEASACRRVHYRYRPSTPSTLAGRPQRGGSRKPKAVGFVRLRFICRPALPPSHPCAAQPAWLMVDEIFLAE